MTETVTLKISGMSCNMCALAVETGLEELSGVKKVSVSYAKEKGVVAYDPNLLQLSDLTSAVEKLGYSASELLEKKRR